MQERFHSEVPMVRITGLAKRRLMAYNVVLKRLVNDNLWNVTT